MQCTPVQVPEGVFGIRSPPHRPPPPPPPLLPKDRAVNSPQPRVCHHLRTSEVPSAPWIILPSGGLRHGRLRTLRSRNPQPASRSLHASPVSIYNHGAGAGTPFGDSFLRGSGTPSRIAGGLCKCPASIHAQMLRAPFSGPLRGFFEGSTLGDSAWGHLQRMCAQGQHPPINSPAFHTHCIQAIAWWQKRGGRAGWVGQRPTTTLCT